MLLKVFQGCEILIFFNPEIHLKDTQSAIKNNVKILLPELRGFKIVTTY